ncbi:hypothetical protein Baya_14347 [Bagarius yarrelli]|uniref:Uncharacterized protein n=1 Tax=Bagarius yarrelli TaxID=175774 RepID=A0A556V8X6_BAGYA|nr:hypothetical protein Baya_14347 [Bagarius yarrelli]
MEQPLMIHGLSIPEYQDVYHSVVDPKIVTSTGRPLCYSRELGRRIKQCPAFKKEKQGHGNEQVHYTEKFSAPTQKSFAPRFGLDISYEPKPTAWTLVSNVQNQITDPTSSRTDNKSSEEDKTKAAQDKDLRRLAPHLEGFYIRDVAEIPKFRLRPSLFATAAPGIGGAGEPVMVQPFMPDDLNIAEYQSVHQSVVDSEFGTSTRQPRCYSMEVDHRIQQRLWEPLTSEQVKFSAPARNSFAHRINTDINFEPEFMVRTLNSDLQQQSSNYASMSADHKTVETVNRRKTAQQVKLWKLRPHEFRPQSAFFTVAASGICTTSKSPMDQSLMALGLQVPEYLNVHQSVNSLLVKATGQPCENSMELGCRDKKRLWNPHNCSTVIKLEQIHTNKQEDNVEEFRAPSRKSSSHQCELQP